MFNNYLYLLRHSKELALDIIGLTFSEAYTQEKDQILFKISDDFNYPDRHLIFSTKPSSPTFYIKNEHKKAKKNVINFFTKFLPAKIIDIQFCKSDRILKIILSSSILYFYYSGPKTNLVIINNFDIESFKKVEKELLGEKSNNLNELSYYKVNEKFEIKDEKEFYENKTFKLIAELRYKITDYNFTIKKEIIKLIKNDDISVFWDKNLSKISFLPTNTISIDHIDSERIFKDVNSAIIYYQNLTFRTKKIIDIRQKITKFVEKELERLSEKLNNLTKRINEGNKENLYRYFGNLLLTNLYNYKRIDEETVSVFCYEKDDYVNIKIKKDIDIKKNIDFYFEKANAEKINYGKSIELFNTKKAEYESLLKYKNINFDTKSVEELEQLIKELKINMNSTKEKETEDKFNFKVYLIEGKYKLFVGRDSTNNDLLTTKFAKQNDFWFHVRGTSGSHAVLRVENLKEAIPKNILKIAASITAYHSKAKTAGIVPVVYTLKKYVIKKKGMNVGQVALLKEDVLLVKPEIPVNCEYLSESD